MKKRVYPPPMKCFPVRLQPVDYDRFFLAATRNNMKMAEYARAIILRVLAEEQK